MSINIEKILNCSPSARELESLFDIILKTEKTELVDLFVRHLKRHIDYDDSSRREKISYSQWFWEPFKYLITTFKEYAEKNCKEDPMYDYFIKTH